MGTSRNVPITDPLTIDVVGFSRGAATARAWVNQLRARLQDGAYQSGGKSRCIQFNFAGLWDTVPHLGALHEDEGKYDFSIPPEMRFAAHANALNEYRGGPADFDTHSILSNASASAQPNRIERGFLGAHSDIGGGYGTGDLSDVALMWMIEQATKNGVTIDRDVATEKGWDAVENPMIHDSSSNLMHGKPEGGPDVWSEDRMVVYADKSTVLQRKKEDASQMTYADTLAFIKYSSNPNSHDVISGTVDMKAYCTWLNAHDYLLKENLCK